MLAIKFNRDWCIPVKVLSEIGTCPLKYVRKVFPDVLPFKCVAEQKSFSVEIHL